MILLWVWSGIFRENDKGSNLVKTTTRFAALTPKYKISNAAFSLFADNCPNAGTFINTQRLILCNFP